MAVEAKRGCGFRIVDGLYLVCGGTAFPCDRLTFEIPEVCPCCGNGTKFSRGWTWVDPDRFFGGDHVPEVEKIADHPALIHEPEAKEFVAGYLCDCLDGLCPVCRPARMNGRAALLWIGEKHYTPQEFKDEAAKLGVSKRIAGIPRDLVLGQTWVLCAHKKAITREDPVETHNAEGGTTDVLFQENHYPGVFFAFKPTRIERIVKQSDFDLYQRVEAMSEEDREAWLSGSRTLKEKVDGLFRSGNVVKKEIEIYKKLAADAKRGITFVPVPDDDPDHNPEVKK